MPHWKFVVIDGVLTVLPQALCVEAMLSAFFEQKHLSCTRSFKIFNILEVQRANAAFSFFIYLTLESISSS